MKLLATLPLLATLVSCAGPAPGPVGETAVFEPAVACHASHYGSPTLAERGIGGTGSPARTQVADRGIGGTGIVGVVTGFASICVDGLEVRFDKTVPVTINGVVATSGQLRIGQLVVVNASSPAAGSDSVTQARTVSVRYEVSGPIEAVDVKSNTIVVAGQPVMVLPSTWVAGRFGVGDWTSVSGLRQPDGTIVASRLDRARAGALAVRGKVTRENGVTRIGSLVLHGPAATAAKPGTFVFVVGRYADRAADVTSVDLDLLSEDPVRYLEFSAHQLVVQGFVRVASGTVRLNNGREFKAGSDVQGTGSGYRNAIVWLTRTADGSFVATQLHYTNYRAQPRAVRPGADGHGVATPALPPYLPPEPATDAAPAGANDMEPQADAPPMADDATGIVEPESPNDVPSSDAVPLHGNPFTDGAIVADRQPTLPACTRPAVRIAAVR
jgi:hypothetical protein